MPPAPDVEPFDVPPSSDDIARLLASAFPFDPWKLGDWAQYVENCGRGRVHTFDRGRFRSSTSMCRTLSCLSTTCARWKIDGREGSWRQVYDEMPEPLFASASAVYVQPWPNTPAYFGRVGKVSVRLKRSRAQWLRAAVFAPDCEHQAVFVFAGDVDPSRPGDPWPAWKLTPDDARSLYLDVILKPGVLAHKPSSSRGPWALPPEPTSGTSLHLGMTWDGDTDREVIDEAERLYASKMRRHVALGGSHEVSEALQREWGASAYRQAKATVLANRQVPGAA